jgi:hypothetical protein
MNKALSIENKFGFGKNKVTGSKFQDRKEQETIHMSLLTLYSCTEESA